MSNSIVALVTSNLRRSTEPTQLLIDSTHVDPVASGLRFDSVVNCSNIVTIKQQDVLKAIGHLSDATMKDIGECLRAALAIQ
jgi:mRNA interferase MazF